MAKRPRKAKLLEDQYPTHYLPNVGRQVMADGGVPEDTQRAHDFVQEQLYGDTYRPSPVVEKYAGPTAAQALEINRDRPAASASEFVRHQLSKDEPQLPQYDRENVQAWKEGAKELGHLAAYGIPYVGEGLMAYDLANAAKSLARPSASSEDRAMDLVNAGLALPGMGRAAKAAAVAGAALAPEEAQAGVVDRALKAIRAYHGSPHKFDKFDISKIGTGEGAQAYGHGLYFAENPEVAHAYREALSPYGRGDRPEDIAARVLHATRGDRDAALAELRNRADTSLQAGGSYEGAQRLMEARNIVNTNPEVAGHMYEVDIHANPEHLIDWDKPIANQPNVVRGLNQYIDEMGGEQALNHFSKELEAKRRAEEESFARLWEDDQPLDLSDMMTYFNKNKYSSKEALTDLLRNIRNDEEPIGAEFYRSLAPQEYDYKGATETARRLGIPGLKYFDRLSRGAGTGSRNYVMFDPNLVDITRRYAKGGDVEGYDKGGAIAKVLGKLMAPGSGYAPRKGFPELVNLPGIGKVESRPIPEIESIARRFAGEAHGADVTPLNPEFSKRVAQEYDVMRHDPQDPIVKRAFQALADETMQQYRAAKDLGLDIKFLKPGQADPYAASPALGYEDIVNRGRLFVYPTEAGFGSTGGINASNVLLKGAGRIGDKEDAVVNDAFRVIHDLYGHFGPGNPFFRAPGEERAFQLHKRMFSPEARPALTSETRGQNSWVNFGDMAERNRAASGADTYYADQKTGIMPKWTMEEPPAEGVDVEEYIRKHRADGGEVVKRALQLVQNPNFKKWFEGSKAVNEAGDPLRLYHGTTVWDRGDRSLGDFNEFDRMASVTQVRRPQWVDTIGSWFSDNPGERGAGLYSGDEGAIYPVYLNIKKPMSATFDDLLNKAKEIGPQVVDKFQSTPRKKYYKTAPEAYEKLHHWIKDQGYDSVIIPKGSTQEFEHQNVYIATDPRQIKSATGNIGTFDPLNPDIRKSEGGDVEGYDKGGAIAKALQAASRIIAPSEKMGVVHSLTPHRLHELSTMDWTGVPSPSLAITKPSRGWDDFGGVGLVGGRHLAEPSNINPIIGADAYTPRVPTIQVEAPVGGWRDDSFGQHLSTEGRRRYFNRPSPDLETYEKIDATLPNIVQHMTSRPLIGGERIYSGIRDVAPTYGEIKAHLAPQFKDFEDLLSHRDKLITDADAFSRINLKNDNEHYAIADALNRYAAPGLSSSTSSANRLARAILDRLKTGEESWNKYYQNVPEELMQRYKIHEQDLRDEPRLYFEGKPQRAVDYGEFAGAMVPEKSVKDVEPLLKNMGIKNIVPYDPAAKAGEEAHQGSRIMSNFGEHMFADGGPVKNIPRADDEQFFRRLALWTYSVAPLFSNTHQLSQNRLGYAGGGKAAQELIERAVRAAKVITSEGAPTVRNMARETPLYPDVYKNPRLLAEEAEGRVAKEDPILKQLWGVNREDIYDIAGNRPGNVEPVLAPPPAKTRGINYASEAVMVPENAERLKNILEAGYEKPGLRKGMMPWYYMDPVYNRLEQMFGPEEAVNRYNLLNTSVSMMSPASNVKTEINRGLGAYHMALQGRFDDFVRGGGKPSAAPAGVIPPYMRDRMVGHLAHSTSQAGPLSKYMQTGKVEMESPKVPLYIQSSGVPETGFQTKLPVPDAHYTRVVGMPDVRRTADPEVSMKMNEYRPVGHWFREEVAKPMEMEAVPAQALMWGTGSGATGVDTAIGAPKLELLSQHIGDVAKHYRISPETARDLLLQGTLYKDGGAVIDRALDVVSNLPHARA